MRPKQRKKRKLEAPLLNVARNMGKWKPEDDFLLIQSIMQLDCLEDVHMLTKFTKKFTLNELNERWYAILYDAPISKLIYNNMKKLHSDDVLRLKKLAPFSKSENKHLISIHSDINTDEEFFFDEFLKKNRTKFYDSRIPMQLKDQWCLLKDLQLLEDQKHKNCIDESLEISFNELEDRLNDKIIEETVDLNEPEENNAMINSYNILMREIKRSEADLFLWQVLLDKITDKPNPFGEVDTLALLFSEKIEFKMKKKEISLGRSSSNTEVDFNLGIINENKKISRKQCIIVHLKSNLFYLFNRGKLPVFVDGNPVVLNDKIQLNDKSLIEVNFLVP